MPGPASGYALERRTLPSAPSARGTSSACAGTFCPLLHPMC